VVPRHRAGRLKQWLNLLRRRFAEAEALYQRLRPHNDPQVVARLCFGAGLAADEPPSTRSHPEAITA
jgi:tRNA-dihydrouridine synthase C